MKQYILTLFLLCFFRNILLFLYLYKLGKLYRFTISQYNIEFKWLILEFKNIIQIEKHDVFKFVSI